MIPPFTADHIHMLLEGLRKLALFDNHTSNQAAQESQTGAQSRMLIRAGDRQRLRQELEFLLRERLTQLTGMPEIHHGNADLRSESTYYPLTREQEAQEANHRG